MESNWMYNNYSTFECWDWVGQKKLYGNRIQATISRDYMSKEYQFAAGCYSDSPVNHFTIAIFRCNYPRLERAQDAMENFVQFINHNYFEGEINETK